jgi:hypothetical protein
MSAPGQGEGGWYACGVAKEAAAVMRCTRGQDVQSHIELAGTKTISHYHSLLNIQ